MNIRTFFSTTLCIGTLLGSTITSANTSIYVEPPAIENVANTSSYVSYMYRTEALRSQWIGNNPMFFIRLSSIDTFGDTRTALIATLLNGAYAIERIATNCNTKETVIKTKAIYDATGKLIESNNQDINLGRPIPDSYVAEAILVMCDALALVPGNPNVHDEKIKASVPFINIINEHVRGKSVNRGAIIVDNIEDYFKSQLNRKK